MHSSSVTSGLKALLVESKAFKNPEYHLFSISLIPCYSSHALKLHFALVHKTICAFEYLVKGVVGLGIKIRKAQRGNYFIAPYILFYN